MIGGPSGTIVVGRSQKTAVCKGDALANVTRRERGLEGLERDNLQVKRFKSLAGVA
jgi:hypothetical protein